MEKIANLKDLKKGDSLYFTYKDQKSILIRTNDDDLVAYLAICPHEGGGLEWDSSINIILCECHLSLFKAKDGSVYRHSNAFELHKGLTKVELNVDDNKDIFAV